MEKQENIFHGVALFFCIDIIVTLLINILQITVYKLTTDLYLIPVLSLAIYAAVLYFVFGKVKKFPQITLLLFASMLIIRILSINVPRLFSSDEEIRLLERISIFNDIAELIYTLVFAGLAYLYYQKGLKDNQDQAYVYYGIILIILAYSVADIITSLLMIVARNYYIHPAGAVISAICCITLLIYLFIRLIKYSPAIFPLILFILVIAQYMVPYLRITGDLLSLYKDMNDYALTLTFLATIRGFTYILLCVISFVSYYFLQKGKISFPKVKGSLIVALFFIICILPNYATNYLLHVKSLNESINKVKSEFPSIISSHIPEMSPFLYHSRFNYDRYQSIIIYYKGNLEIKKGEALLEKGYLEKYNANDPHLVWLNTHRIKEKLNVKSIRYETLDINEKMYYPLPDLDFEDISFDELSLYGLPSDFTIYVLDARPQKLIDDNSLAGIMPDGWENGYSKGICISKQRNIVIYWGAAW